jgi:oligosaccharide repeat unit polymerase
MVAILHISPAAATVFLSVIAGLVVAFFLVADGEDTGVSASCLAIFYLLLLSAVRRPIRIAPYVPGFVTIELLFLIFCFFVCYLSYQQALLGLLDIGASRFVPKTFSEEASRAILLSTAGIVAFSFGFRWKRAYLVGPPPVADNRNIALLPQLVLVGLVGLMSVYLLAGWRAEGEGRYTGTSFGGVLAEGASLLVTMLSMMALALVVARLARRERPGFAEWCSALLAIVWGVRLLSLGDRNAALLLLIVLGGGLATFRFRIGRLTILAALLLSLHVYDRVETLRGEDEWGLADLATVSDHSGETSFNISAITVRAALATVPAEEGFALGLYKLYGFAGVVPFVRGLAVAGHDLILTSADYLTRVMLPANAGWNVGTSLIADIYVDFGVFGVPMAMFLLGRIAGWAQNRVIADPFSTRKIVTYLLTLALFAELPRYAADFPVRILVWSGALMLLARWMTPQPIPHPAYQTVGSG